MRYLLTKEVMGFGKYIEISSIEYHSIKSARDNLFEILFLEEKLDLVTENYCEFEKELLSIASRNMVFYEFDYFNGNQERTLISRRIINLLSSGRMYLDQSIHHLVRLYGETNDIVKNIKSEKNTQYDQKLGYRVMEALRNYVQHRGFAIHNAIFQHQWIEIEDNNKSRLMHRIIPKISISALEEDGNFKKSILNELKLINETDLIDARPLIREYIEGIGLIQTRIRELLKPDIILWEQKIEETITRFKKEFGDDIPIAGLVIAAVEEDETWIEKRSIFNLFIERIHAFERKNRLYNNLHKRYSTNEL